MAGLINLLIAVVVVGVVVAIVWYIIDYMPILPAPFKRLAKMLLLLIALLVILWRALPLLGVAA